MADPTQQIENSILHDVKQIIGQEWDDLTFDLDLKTFINSTFFTLKQIGVGPTTAYRISGPENLWTEFLGADGDLEIVKEYVYIKVRLTFDPPATGPLVNALKETAKELEWRIMVYKDPAVNFDEFGGIDE